VLIPEADFFKLMLHPYISIPVALLPAGALYMMVRLSNKAHRNASNSLELKIQSEKAHTIAKRFAWAVGLIFSLIFTGIQLFQLATTTTKIDFMAVIVVGLLCGLIVFIGACIGTIVYIVSYLLCEIYFKICSRAT
jgi:hypothetical protein